MSLYAIGDLHLHFQTDLKAKAQIKERAWKNHEQKVQKYCAEMIQPDDTLVLVGDHSWGRNLDECVQDLQFIAELPGRKILLRGNHDMFWDAKKTQMLNERYAGKLLFLQDNFYPYEDYLIGPVARNTDELLDSLRNYTRDDEKVKKFCEKFISACDGHSAERFVEKVIDNK